MSIGVIATWRVLPGREQEAEDLLLEMRRHTILEPGCLHYVLHRLPDGDGFLLYEQYVDRQAIEAHHAAPYYQELVATRAPALLERREVERLEVVP